MSIPAFDTAALYQVNVVMNPVTKKLEVASNVGDLTMQIGMLELAKAALLDRQRNANSGKRIEIASQVPA